MLVVHNVALVILCVISAANWWQLRRLVMKTELTRKQCDYIQVQIGLTHDVLRANAKDHGNLRETMTAYIEELNQKYVRKAALLAEIKRAACAEKRD